MRGDLNEILRTSSSTNYNVIVLTETWLRSDHLDSEILGPSWQVFRCDRSLKEGQTRGGGVLVAVHNSFACSSVNFDYVNCNLNCNLSQQVWVKITAADKNIFICCCYIHFGADITVYQQCTSTFEDIIEKIPKNDDVFIFGDFNLAGIKWIPSDDNEYIFDPTNISTEEQTSILDLFAEQGYSQICNFKNSSYNVLDLIFTNVCDNYIANETRSIVAGKSSIHHCCIELSYFFSDANLYKIKDSFLDFDFTKANYVNINKYICDNTHLIDSNSDVNEKVRKFIGIINTTFNIFVPKKIKTLTHHPPWYNKELINLKNIKNKAHRKWVNSNNITDFILFEEYKRLFDELDVHSYNKYVLDCGDSIKKNPRYFYKFINYKRNMSSIPQTMFYDNLKLTNPVDISENFAKFFESVYSKPISFDKDKFNYIYANSDHLSNININQEELLKELISVDVNKGCGPDRIPAYFIKKVATSITDPLLDIFNSSLSCGIFPSMWKSSYICPIFKSGDKCLINNYRGIAILSLIPKLFEKIVTKKIVSFSSNLISDYQHGFISGRSTTTNLTGYTQFILKAMNDGNQVDSIYTDFSKAFDKVDHKLLLFKLHKYGFDGSILQWIESYLSGRSQMIKLNNNMSRPLMVTSGVPQGSHLGPVLFILFINDLVSLLTDVLILLYADDLKLFLSIKKPEDVEILQRCIDKLNNWCISNGMLLNIDKCYVISFSRKKSKLLYDYSIASHKLGRETTVKDLGVLLDDRLDFKSHIDKVCTQSKRMLGFVKRRAMEFRDPYVTKSIYCSLVRSTLEYCHVVWSPLYKSDIDRIESVQKQFLIFALRHTFNNNNNNTNPFVLPSYDSRLKLLSIDTLKNRREVSDAMFAFDLLKGNIKSTSLCDKIQINPTPRILRHTKYLSEITYNCNYANHEPFNRCSKSFNNFYSLYDPNMSREVFKSKIKNSLR